uniref:Golgi apparatus protein 1 n=1 Tax=Denticeps clupeoides TaxID=299321 RepID=A0AAY4DBC6_9TELE
MAACGRVELLALLLLLLLLSAALCSRSVQAFKSPANGAPPLQNLQLRVAGLSNAQASQSRRSGGWKLAEEAACREDLTRLCPKHTWNNNLAVLECLQDRKEETEIATDCNHLLWNYKLNLTTDSKFESVAVEVCKSTITEDLHSQGEVIACLERALVREAEQQDHAHTIQEECKKAIMRVAELSADDFHLDRYLYFSCRDDRERFCENTQVGEGRVYKCLFNHKFEEAMSEKCRDALTTRQKLIAQDYKVSYSLTKACKADLRKYRCNLDTNMPRVREARLSYLLLCLESAVHRGRTVSGDCQGEMLDYRRMLMEDYSLSPEIVLHCRGEIDAHCSGLHRKGRTLHCLMRVSRGDKGTMDTLCQNALQALVQSADPGADYRIDRALNEACESVIQTACKHIRNGDPMILSCLMEHLYTEKMVEDCEHRLLELQYFISRDWKLDPLLYRKCQSDAARLCHTHSWNETNELMPHGAVFSCLYRHAYRTEEQGRRLSRDCKVEVQRILHQRALDVKLDPELQKRCMTDLGKWCSEKTETGQELECLQDHLEDLVTDCRDVVGNLTELESEDIQIEALLIRACEALIQSHCHEFADNQIDSGDLMECLVQNKHQKEMNDKCSVGVTHFQLVCKDIRLEPELYDSCKHDIKRLCPAVDFGNAQASSTVVFCFFLNITDLMGIHCLICSLYLIIWVMIECLKENKKQLSQLCHQKIFRLQEIEMMDPELDYQLMRVCKQMIKRFCSEADAKNMLNCLKQNKNNEMMDPKCKQMITKRQITQNTDYRLNPVLRKACKADIPKFCQDILRKASDDSELEGQVISCLKLKYADQRLSSDCEDQIRVILQESALDYRLDPQLQLHCSEEITRLCAEEAAAQEQTGQVEECLKGNLLKLKHEACKKEVLNMLKESKADIFVDPVLHTACALDLKHHCAAIPPGRGRPLFYSLYTLAIPLEHINDHVSVCPSFSICQVTRTADGFVDLAARVLQSPSKNYILLMIALAVCMLFLIGLLCGRITKRVTRELKDR